jgi:DNA-binding LytR/AlgR family response regulator
MTIVTLKRMVKLLPPDEFCQIHRAFIVSLNWITAFDVKLVYGPDQMLPIGETYRKTLSSRVLPVGEERKTIFQTLR